MTTLAAHQYAFTQAIRRNNDETDLYRNLIFNHFLATVKRCFPMTAQILTTQRLHDLVHSFMHCHVCTSPYFHQIPASFIQYVQTANLDKVPECLTALLHYEWLALEVALAPDCMKAQAPDTIALASHVRLAAYPFLVHQINRDYIPITQEETPTYIMLHRDKQMALKIEVLTPRAAELLQPFQTPQRNDGLDEFLQQCLARGILVVARSAP